MLPEVEAAIPGRQYELPWGNACPVLDPQGKAHAISSECHLAVERTWNLELDWIRAQGGTKAGWIDARHLCHLSPATYTLPPSSTPHLPSYFPTSQASTLPHPSPIPHPSTLPHAPCTCPLLRALGLLCSSPVAPERVGFSSAWGGVPLAGKAPSQWQG